jgi:hypothetical protein
MATKEMAPAQSQGSPAVARFAELLAAQKRGGSL